MKLIIHQIILLICILCLLSSAESYSYLEHLSITGKINSKGQTGLHSLHKRNTELIQMRQCQGIAQNEQCNNGLAQEAANLVLRCGALEWLKFYRKAVNAIPGGNPAA